MSTLLRYILYLLPLAFLSRLFGVFSRIQFPKNLQLYINNYYACLFQLNMSEASQKLDEYKSLNALFVRQLKPSVRTIPKKEAKAILSPVDGKMYSSGKLEEKTLLTIKQQHYIMAELLLASEKSQFFLGGSYQIFYLSPKDCHRIFSPCDANITGYHYISGKLFPVNEWAVAHIPALFTRNERLILWLEHKKKEMALIAVGATNVGSIHFNYANKEYLPRGTNACSWAKKLFP